MKAVRDVANSSLLDLEHKTEDLQTKASKVIADLSKGAIENIHAVRKTTLETLSDAVHTSKSEVEHTVCSGISTFETVAANERWKIEEGIHLLLYELLQKLLHNKHMIVCGVNNILVNYK